MLELMPGQRKPQLRAINNHIPSVLGRAMVENRGDLDPGPVEVPFSSRAGVLC